jgi:hypothetical protein
MATVLLRVGPLGRILRENPNLKTDAEPKLRAALADHEEHGVVALRAASVSSNVRCVSANVRPAPDCVSDNVRRNGHLLRVEPFIIVRRYNYGYAILITRKGVIGTNSWTTSRRARVHCYGGLKRAPLGGDLRN